jgi:putative NIF3 family GTP cyclohydrolase 1 type 2
MAKAFGVTGLTPLAATTGGFGHGVLGTLPEPVSLADFAKTVAKALPETARKVVFSGSPEQRITSVAICSGAGDSFLQVVIESGADVYVTSDLRHHPALDAITTPRPGNSLALIDVSHWAAESLWVTNAVQKLSNEPGIEVIASTQNTDPWTQEVD